MSEREGDRLAETVPEDGQSGGSGGESTADGGSAGSSEAGPVPDVESLLAEIGFDEDDSVLTKRQAEVLSLREHGIKQQRIAEWLGTSRANVSSIESSARENIQKARETIAFAEALSAPVRVSIDEETDLYDVPNLVFQACDEAGVKVTYTAPDLMKKVSDEAGDAVRGREVKERISVGVTNDGTVHVRTE